PTTGSVENQNASGAASSPGASQAGAATSENTSANQGDQQNLRSSSLQGYSSSGSRETGKDGFSVKVQGTSESDRAIGQQITQSLRADPEVASSLPTVRISIENGKAILQGSVKSDAQRRKLETLIQQTTGVSSVENQLRVSGAGGGTTNP
ncbi:MAG TPA: BON domain-containing protein, partial [Verrucomicrobiae bacterium]|nr:BON domain-containing protein [Verrucomicrobiae bacterium]